MVKIVTKNSHKVLYQIADPYLWPENLTYSYLFFPVLELRV